jgi:hypothetical protein
MIGPIPRNRASAFSRHGLPETSIKIPAPLKSEGARAPEKGAGNAGCGVYPQPLCETHTVVTTGPPKTPGIPARWLYGLLRALPGDEFLLTPSPTDQSGRLGPHISAGLTSATDARTTRLGRTQRPLVTPSASKCAAAEVLSRGVEAPLVRTRDRIAHSKAALQSRPRDDAAASTASHPASVAIAIRPFVGETGGLKK